MKYHKFLFILFLSVFTISGQFILIHFSLADTSLNGISEIFNDHHVQLGNENEEEDYVVLSGETLIKNEKELITTVARLADGAYLDVDLVPSVDDLWYQEKGLTLNESNPDGFIRLNTLLENGDYRTVQNIDKYNTLNSLNELTGCELYVFFNKKTDNSDKKPAPAGLICYRNVKTKAGEPPQKQIIVAYRGTEGRPSRYKNKECLMGFFGEDWCTNIKVFGQVPTNNTIEIPDGYMHPGFWNGYSKSKDHLLKSLREIAKEKNFKQNQDQEKVSLVFTGHSMGGALSTIATADALVSVHSADEIPAEASTETTLEWKEHKSWLDKNAIRMITFASPRVFDLKAVNYLLNTFEFNTENNGFRRFIRIWRKHDPVSIVLFRRVFGFKHLGYAYKLPPITSPLDSWPNWISRPTSAFVDAFSGNKNHSMTIFRKQVEEGSPGDLPPVAASFMETIKEYIPQSIKQCFDSIASFFRR